VEYWGKAAGGHDVGEVIADLQARLRGMLEKILKEGPGGEGIKGVNPARAAAVILGSLEGILLQWRVSGARVDLAGSLAELECMVETVMRGGAVDVGKSVPGS
jgi:hypothetical protein